MCNNSLRYCKSIFLWKAADLSLNKKLGELETPTMVMQDARQPPASHIMIRGDYTTPGDPVETGVLSALHPLDTTLPRNRLGLAQWLTTDTAFLTFSMVHPS